jgi:hypothetical protein
MRYTTLQITKLNDRHLRNFRAAARGHFPITLVLVMWAKRSNPSAVSTRRKKPFLQYTFRCPHPNCNKNYKSVNGLRIQHFGKSPQFASFRMSIHNRQAQAELQPSPLKHLEALTEYPWDDEKSLNKLHEAVIVNSMDDNSGSGAPNNQAGGVFSESANDAAF